jgi:sulfur-oxidizing protein SoxX
MKRVFLSVALSIPAAALGQTTSTEVQKVLQRDFHPRGQAKMERVIQDGVQRVCTQSNDRPPGELARQLEADQMKTIAFPPGNLMGDWKNGERIAQNGRGLQWTDAAGAPGGGSCYNCHQISPQETSHGTLGPSLRRFGWMRGDGPQMQRYVYGKIYNAKAYNLCSQMPRLGYSGTLTPEQIKDLVALLLDPASPVNR